MRQYSFFYLLPFFAACGGATSPGGGSGDGDNPSAMGDGDGDKQPPNGDGDDPPGDGDGDGTPGDGGTSSGDGDGDVLPGDGDGDTLPGDGDGDGATGGMGGSIDGSGGFGGSMFEGDAETFCTAACEALTPPAGSCADFYVCGEDAQCRQGADEWSNAARGAFEWCYQNDPMCFISAEGCMLNRLFGVDSPLTHQVSGSGFEVPDGTKIGVAADTNTKVTVEMQGGAFQLELEARRSQGNGTYLVLWLDQNGDGICSEGDRVGWTQPTFNSNFDSPMMVSEVGPAELSETNPQNCSGFF